MSSLMRPLAAAALGMLTVFTIQEAPKARKMIRTLSSRATGPDKPTPSLEQLAFTGVHLFVLTFFILLKSLLGCFGLGPRWQTRKPSSAGGEETLAMDKVALSAPLNLDARDFESIQALCKLTAAQNASPRPTGASVDLPPRSSSLPTSQFWVIAATNPLMICLLAHLRCPIMPLGALHVRNRFEFLDPSALLKYSAGSEPNKAGQAAPLWAHGEIGGFDSPGGVRRVKRGIEVDIVIHVLPSSSAPIEKALFRQVITVLQMSKKWALQAAKPQVLAKEEDTIPSWHLWRSLHLTSAVPLKWAAMSGDYNPIHISPILAKVFGMKSTIAHGNSLVVSAFDAGSASSKSGKKSSDSAQDAVEELTRGAVGPWWLEVSFRKPMLLPLDLTIQVSQEGDAKSIPSSIKWRAHSEKGDSTYVEGSMGPLKR